MARQADGNLDGAEEAFRGSLATSEHLPLFTCWAHARLALVLVATNRPDEAAWHVARALATGPPLGHYEARLAHCELAVTRAEPDAPKLVAAHPTAPGKAGIGPASPACWPCVNDAGHQRAGRTLAARHGAMLGLSRNRLSGSQRRLTDTSRS